jgi:hypothetical protein
MRMHRVWNNKFNEWWHFNTLQAAATFDACGDILDFDHVYESTGLKDRRGHEIFEGDILAMRCRRKRVEYGYNGEVVFRHGAFCLKWMDNFVRDIKWHMEGNKENEDKYSNGMPMATCAPGSPWEIVGDCRNGIYVMEEVSGHKKAKDAVGPSREGFDSAE